MFDVVCPRCLVEAGQKQTMAAEKPEVELLGSPEGQEAGSMGRMNIAHRCPRCPCKINLTLPFRVLAWK